MHGRLRIAFIPVRVLARENVLKLSPIKHWSGRAVFNIYHAVDDAGIKNILIDAAHGLNGFRPVDFRIRKIFAGFFAEDVLNRVEIDGQRDSERQSALDELRLR